MGGYRGKVILRSPSGEHTELHLFGRHMKYGLRSASSRPKGQSRVAPNVWGDGNPGRSAERANRRFYRLLSAGWKVVKQYDFEPDADDSEAGEEEKKDASLVVGTTQTGSASHGGKHASAEVEDSPNAAKRGKRERKCRGGQKNRRKKKGSQRRVRIRVQHANGGSNAAVYAPQPLQVTPKLLASAEQSAELLAELVGRSPLKVERGIRVNTEKLLIALETGDDPVPTLEERDERPKLKILVTPDCSGSTQSWNGLGQAWALHLSRLPDVDVIYFTNFNGEFWNQEADAESRRLIESVDVVLYLGDGDGQELCQQYASHGAIVVGLDSFCANVARPRLKSKTIGQGVIHWVDRVSANEPDTWARSIELCLKQ